MTSIAEAALEYARAGWRVLPVDAKTKRPRTRHGVLDASSDPNIVAYWQGLFDEGGAIATPTGDGLLVIDIDPRNGGERKPWMPPTREVSTQSGGIHLHYRINQDIKSRANLFGPGIDSKCKGGYVLIPPSPGYEWVNLDVIVGMFRDELERHVNHEYFPSGTQGGAARKHPSEWRKGMIHDQVVAWAGYFAAEHPEEVTENVWGLIAIAREAGCPIDNAGGHIDAAIRWVLQREAQKRRMPSLD